MANLATKSDLLVLGAELRRDMADLKVELIKWQIGSTTAILLAMFVAIMRLG